MKQIQIKRPYNVENTSNNDWKGQFFLIKKDTKTSSTFDKNTPSYIQELKALSNLEKTIAKWWNSQLTLSQKKIGFKNKHTNLRKKSNK